MHVRARKALSFGGAFGIDGRSDLQELHLPGRSPVGRMRANGRPAGRTFFETSPDHRAPDARPATNDLDAARRTHATALPRSDRVRRSGHHRLRLRRRRYAESTGVGQLEDKSFNQSSNEGAEAAATTTGGTHDVIVTQSISDYGANIQQFVDQDFDVIVTVGFLIGTDTAKAAKANP